MADNPDRTPRELRCPQCHGKDIVPSLPHGVWDAIMSGMGRVPRHCRSCGKRFHPKAEAAAQNSELRAQPR